MRPPRPLCRTPNARSTQIMKLSPEDKELGIENFYAAIGSRHTSVQYSARA